jgi:hypothetical protein
VGKWHLSVRRGGQDSAVVTSTVARLRLDLGEVMAEWGPWCSKNSVILEYYSFSVRAEVVNSEGDVFRRPLSDQTVQHTSPTLGCAGPGAGDHPCGGVGCVCLRVLLLLLVHGEEGYDNEDRRETIVVP